MTWSPGRKLLLQSLLVELSGDKLASLPCWRHCLHADAMSLIGWPQQPRWKFLFWSSLIASGDGDTSVLSLLEGVCVEEYDLLIGVYFISCNGSAVVVHAMYSAFSCIWLWLCASENAEAGRLILPFWNKNMIYMIAIPHVEFMFFATYIEHIRKLGTG